MTRAIQSHDHPDFIGGIVWTAMEVRWIEARIAGELAATNARIAELEREKAAAMGLQEGAAKLLAQAQERIDELRTALSDCADELDSYGDEMPFTDVGREAHVARVKKFREVVKA